jgi:hypothetical protein
MPRSPLLLNIALQSPDDHQPNVKMNRSSQNSFNSDSVDEIRQRLDDIFDSGLIPTPPETSLISHSPKVSAEIVQERCQRHVEETGKALDRASDDFEKVYNAFLRETSRTDSLSSSSSRYGPAPTKPPLRPLPSVPSHHSEILALDQMNTRGSAPRHLQEGRTVREQDRLSPDQHSSPTDLKQLSRPGTSASTAYGEPEKRTWRVSVKQRDPSRSDVADDSDDLFKPLTSKQKASESEQPIRRAPLLLNNSELMSRSEREKKLAQLRAQQLALQMEQKRLEEQEAAEQERLRRETEERHAHQRRNRSTHSKAAAQDDDMASELEVASLRAQVAQLQFALKKQMSGQSTMDLTGLPTPEQSYSGSVHAGFHGQRTPSFNAINGSQYYPSTPHSQDGGAPSIRSTNSQARAKATQEQIDYRAGTSARYDESVGYQSSARSRYDNASLLSSLHNTSMTNRSDGDMRVEEIAAKLAQLEDMFRTVGAMSNPTNSPTYAQAPSLATDRRPSNSAHASQHTLQAHNVMRSNSSVSSTYDQSIGRVSPVSSVFVYNPTSPYEAKQAATNSTSSVNSTVKLENGTKATPIMRKGVSRFLLGSTAKLADANGAEIPSVQVSLSRKRGDRVEKPKAKVKSVGRGRVAVVYDKK